MNSASATWRRLRRNRGAMLGGVALLLIAAFATFGLFYARARFNDMIFDPRLGPSRTHWMGTDDLGRDLMLRLLYGAHLTLGVGVSAIALASLLGIPLGLAAAYLGGRVDSVAMRSTDVLLAFPSILLAMAVVAALGFSLQTVTVAVGICYAPQFARVARAAALSERHQEYISAAEAIGCRAPRILFRHLLPNCMGPLIVLATLSVATAVLEAAALSFLGLGAQPPLPEWGRMLNDGRATFQTHPHMMLAPGLALAITALSINLVGDGLRDALDVR